MIRAAALCVLAILAGVPDAGAAGYSLVLDRTIPLRKVTGRIDHLAIDLSRHHLFVAELGNDSLDVVDLARNETIRRVNGLSEPQGVAYVPGADIVAVANGGDGTVRLFHAANMSPSGMIKLGADADNVRVEARTGRVIVGYGHGGLATIDPVAGTVVGRVPLPAHPEGFQLSLVDRLAYVNVPDAEQIAAVDVASGHQVATWRFPGWHGNFPIAIDPASNRLATVFRHPAHLAVLEANDGRVIGGGETCGDADDVAFDPPRSRIYISCGDGRIDVWRDEGTAPVRVASVRTSSGARTSLFVPELDRLFVAARAGFFGLASDAAILVYRPAE